MEYTSSGLDASKNMGDIFQSEIYPRLFESIRPPLGVPEVVFVGGQPGSGKSSRLRFIVEQLDASLPNGTIEINGDDYRAFHPNYYQLLNEDDSMAASKIDKDVAMLIENSISASMELGCNVVLEGTFRRPDKVIETASRYQEAGYKTQAILLLVHPLLSRLGVVHKYIEQKMLSPFARLTLRQAHDASLSGLPTTVSELIKTASVERLSIVDREGIYMFDVGLSGLGEASLINLAKDAKDIINEGQTKLNSNQVLFAEEQIKYILSRIAGLQIPNLVRDELCSLQSELKVGKNVKD